MKSFNLIKSIPLGISLMLGCSVFATTGGEVTKVETSGNKISSVQSSLQISGVYPHLTTYSHARVDGKYRKGSECGIGAIVVWGGKLYMVNYAAHEPKGSEHNLYVVDADKKMTIFPQSVGGTPAARMIHKETDQLLIGHYVIDSKGNIRVIPIREMPGRISAVARHLVHPEYMVYYYDMEGMLYEVNVKTLKVNKLFNNPLPGWHGKGAYTAQGKLIIANNGEATGSLKRFEKSEEWQVPVDGMDGPEKFGVLAEYDGKNFKVIERKQFTDLTTRNGVNAVPNDQSPLWAIGWDKRSLILKVMENGVWKNYLLPKAAYNNDPSHGWFTEWPRIREIGNNDMMMDMHGMFFDFPMGFSQKQTAGIRPIASHLRYVPDFCSWNGQIVLASDETSVQGNREAGQPQSNLWFGTKNDMKSWGPSTGYGAIYIKDSVQANVTSNPYLFAGFDRRILHLINHGKSNASFVLEVDEKGNDKWKTLQKIELTPGEYQPIIFDGTAKGEWIRIKTNNACVLSAVFHYTQKARTQNPADEKLFEGLAGISDQKVIAGKLYSNRNNFNLSCYASVNENGKGIDSTQKEFDKYSFKFKDGISDSTSRVVLKTSVPYSNIKDEKGGVLWTEDDASIILNTKKNGKLRLPKGNAAFSAFKTGRVVRELESERQLANIHGTMYELPLETAGTEPRFRMMRPVASHNLQIDDYNTWNGLLLMTGIKPDAKDGEHIALSDDKKAAIWMGAIDDLWKLGKPVGKGGPWKNTSVKANKLSDPYLMTGYDSKTLTLEADRETRITVSLIVSQYINEPVIYKTFDLKPGQPVTYKFPDGFSAHWVMVSADKDCKATAQLIYE